MDFRRLIKLAPKLLEALNYVASYLDDQDLPSVVDEVNKVIREAEGSE